MMIYEIGMEYGHRQANLLSETLILAAILCIFAYLEGEKNPV